MTFVQCAPRTGRDFLVQFGDVSTNGNRETSNRVDCPSGKTAKKGDTFDVDLTLDEARPEEFDALLIPGGLMNPDTLRSTPDALEFTKHFFREGKPVAAICHGPWVLIDAGVVRGRDEPRRGRDPRGRDGLA